jgi:starch synthase
LDGVLRGVRSHLVGITNGIDELAWDPRYDPTLTANYDADSWRTGKVANKRSLQQQFGLEVNDDVPLIGLVGRLAQQKGWDLVLPVLRWHLEQQRPTQWIVLGSGEARYEDELRRLTELHPRQCAAHVGFSDELAHRIQAAADLFLMPSLYEPCGLSQLYSLRYGSIPIVTATGGLADTVMDCTDETLADRTATGFHVANPSPDALDEAIGSALALRYHRPEKWDQIVQTGMHQDWSWGKSAAQYADVYERTSALKSAAVDRAI